jgi:Domain of unknown function (DUF4397)
MNAFNKLVLACLPALGLAACGGGDTADRLDLANPTARFVHASAIAPNLTLYRGVTAQTDENNAPYGFASNYFDIDMGVSDWLVKTTVGGVTLGTEAIAPSRGQKYTIVALPTSISTTGTYLIVDPYNKSITSNNARLRVMNASYNAANIDLYMNAIGVDITVPGVNPTIAATVFRTTGPASGGDSIELSGGTYQVTITPAGTKTVLFRGQLTFGADEDLLLLSVPNSVLPGAVKALVKVERTVGLSEVPAS